MIPKLSTPEAVADIIRRMRAGDSMGEIARALGTSIFTVSRRVAEYEAVTGARLPRATCRHKPPADEFETTPAVRCPRCGLRGEHECIHADPTAGLGSWSF